MPPYLLSPRTPTPLGLPATISSVAEPGDDEYGYEYGDFGSITDRTFQHDGRTYTIEYIKWDESHEKIEFGIEECLKPSAFVSLTIGSVTYSNPDRIEEEKDKDCDPDRNDQEFEFHYITSNPLRAGRDIDIARRRIGLADLCRF